MGADISQFKQAELVRHIPDLTKIEEHGDGEGTGKFSIKNHSKSFAHFSDYSMFPDRYNVKSSPKAILGNALFATLLFLINQHVHFRGAFINFGKTIIPCAHMFRFCVFIRYGLDESMKLCFKTKLIYKAKYNK